jgi:hypothetical protein
MVCRARRMQESARLGTQRSHFGKIEFLCARPTNDSINTIAYSMFVGGNVCMLHNGAQFSQKRGKRNLSREAKESASRRDFSQTRRQK